LTWATGIGTPGAPFYFLGDSGAPNLSIESVLEPPAQQGDIPKYDPSKSSTAQQLQGYTYSECFGSGYCDNGVVYTDVFTIGNIAVSNMPIMVQTDNNSPSNGIRSGNLGLNFDKQGMTTVPTRLNSYFQTIMPYLDGECLRRPPDYNESVQGTLMTLFKPAPLWTVDWHASTQSGQFEFGYIDSSKYVGDISWGAVTTTGGEWTIEVQGVQAGYDDSDFNPFQFQVLVDTGTGGGTISRAVADLYWRGVPNSVWSDAWDNYLYPCNQTLPDFVIKLADGTKVGIPDEGLRWKGENGMCATNLAIGDSNDTLWGQHWIERYFVVFDWGNARVGLAKKASQ
jgi:aspergillopepsin I